MSQALVRDLNETLLPQQIRPDGEPLQYRILRSLVPADIEHLVPAGERPSRLIDRTTARHHQLAMWVAQGKSNSEISALGGVSVSRMEDFRKSPAFQELVAHYQEVRECVFSETNERVKMVGLQFLDELQARIDEKPEAFTNQQVIDAAHVLLIKGRAMGEGSPGGGNGVPVQVNVNFVQAKPRLPEGQTIDGQCEVVE